MIFRLPPVPSVEEFDREVPRVPAQSYSTVAPLWSVMIPTYNRPDYLTQTLESLLCQAPGPEEMQIEVCDNYSDSADIESLVRKVGGGRVEYFRQPRPLSDNHNTCIRRARGKWVHILHDDDTLLPGLYTEYQRIIESDPDLVMVAGRVFVADEHLRWKSIAGLLPPMGSNRLDNFVPKQVTTQCAEFCGTVVRRDVYEKVGGLSPLLRFSADRELWLRVALEGPVAGTHRPYAVYRQHANSDWHKLAQDGRMFKDMYTYAVISRERLRRSGHPVPPMYYKEFSEDALIHAWIQDKNGAYKRRLEYALLAWRFHPSFRTLKFFARSWLKALRKRDSYAVQ